MVIEDERRKEWKRERVDEGGGRRERGNVCPPLMLRCPEKNARN